MYSFVDMKDIKTNLHNIFPNSILLYTDLSGLISDIEIRLVNEAHPSKTTARGSAPWTLLGALPLDPAKGL